jgi:hypothetical protein
MTLIRRKFNVYSTRVHLHVYSVGICYLYSIARLGRVLKMRIYENNSFIYIGIYLYIRIFMSLFRAGLTTCRGPRA